MIASLLNTMYLLDMEFYEKKQEANLLVECELKKVLKELNAIFVDVRPQGKMERAESWELFRSFPEDRQFQVKENAQLYLDICLDTLAENKSVRDQRQLIWFALKKLNLIPPPNLFEMIHDDFVVEIYDPFGIQVFRNHRFFEVSSYNFTELFVYPWHELYFRDPAVSEAIQEYGIKLFSGQYKETISINTIPRHEMLELFSPERFVMDMQLKYLAPLKAKNSNLHYAMAISEVEISGRQAQQNRPHSMETPHDAT